MDNIEHSRRFTEGSWSPPQSHSEAHGSSTVESTPHTVDGWIAPMATDYHQNSPLPPGSPTYYSAPEVAEPYMPYGHPVSRAMSPSSQGGTTLMSPTIPPLSLYEKGGAEARVASVPPQDEPKTCDMRRRWFRIVMISIAVWFVALGLSLGLGLGLGLKHHHSDTQTINPYCRDHPELCIGGALGAEFYSKKGAFNGSGIALAGESWNKGQRRIFTLYFQHWTGQIRSMQYTSDQKWSGGTATDVVAVHAKKSTPISAVAYASNGTQTFHIFYIARNNTLRRVTRTNVSDSDSWGPGLLNDLNLQVFDSPSVGLQACWKDKYYGDTDYQKFPTDSGLQNTVPFEDRTGMNIWYPSDESTFQQYTWYEGADQWVRLDPWLGMNGHAGVGCYSWGVGTTTYTMMVNKNNDTEFWWKDTNPNITSTDNHPTMVWRNSTQGAIDNVYPSTSLGYTTFFYAQMADKTIKGFNISYQAENTTFIPADTLTLSDPAGPLPGLGGTHLTCTSYAEMDGNETKWDRLYVFYQTEGDDITAFKKPITDGGP